MYNLHQGSRSNLPEIALCHSECFPGSFSVRLGMAYTIKSFEWFLVGENRFLFYVTANDKVVGYCGGFKPLFAGDGSVSGMMQYGMKQAVMGLIKKPSLLFSNELKAFYPLIFKNIYRKIFKPKRKNITAPVNANGAVENRVGLVVIGIQPAFRGSGIFEMLMQQFEKEALKKQVKKVNLSVKKQNQRAINAYTKQGWKVSNEHAESFEMVKYLS